MGANISELLVKNIVQKYIFTDINWEHQDKPNENLPDICSDDLITGIEVVKAELGVDHLLIDLFEELLKDKKKSCEQIRDEFETWHENKNNEQIKQIRNTLNINDGCPLFKIDRYDKDEANSETEQCWPTFNDLSKSIDYAKKLFEKQIRSKFNKLNDGNYDGVNEIYLAIVSIHRAKDDIAIKGAFESFRSISQEFPSVKFKGLILVFSGLIAWGNNNVRKKEIDDKEFNGLIRRSRSEFKCR